MKKTPLLKAVLSLLEKSSKPLSVPEIQQHLSKQDLHPNKTTLYRMIEKLIQEEVVNSVLLDQKTTYYELKTEQQHHFKCQNCDVIECVTDPELQTQIQALEKKLKEKGLNVTNHHFSFSGTCSKCD